MTYLIKKPRKSAKVGLNIHIEASASSFADDAVISWANIASHASSTYGFNDVTLTNNSSFTLPNDSNVYMFEAALTWHSTTGYQDIDTDAEISYQWYDTTNSQWIGSVATLTSGLAYSEGRTSGTVGDEIARFVSSSAIDVELRLKSSANNYGDLSGVDYTVTNSYYSAARCLVYKFG